jgi:hypothetical protein
VAGFILCLVLGVVLFLGWKSTIQLQQPSPVPPVPQPSPVVAQAATPFAPSDEGRTFTSLPEVFDYYAIQGFVMLGQFPKSDWPARVVYVQDGTNEISFTRKGGPRHTYPGNTGYRLKVVSLEDSSGAETLVVLRSKEKVTGP